jgi:succinate---hydroxymethylglutarate CoA-transferase
MLQGDVPAFQRAADARRAGPLAGLRVLELSQIAAGPFAGSLLADLGADVVKIENPNGGDGMRGWPPLTPNGDGVAFSENFASLNRNKRSVCADLKTESGVSLVKALVRVSDVLIENFRAGTLDRLGLGYKDASLENPRLVYCSITGFGQAGPYAQKGAFDVTIQGISGLMSVTGLDGGPPVKCGVPVADFCAGLYGSYSILAALFRARESGRGAHIDCSMLGALLGIAALQTSEYFGTGLAGKRLGSAHPRNAPYQAFRAADADFIVAAGNDSLWCEVCQAVGAPELTDDPRFESVSARARHQAELAEILQRRFETKTAAEWIAEFDRRGVPCAPIKSYPEILADPHVQATGLLHPVELPNKVLTRTVGYPIGISDFRFEVYRAPPALGEHTREVIGEWLAEDQAVEHPLGEARGG